MKKITQESPLRGAPRKLYLMGPLHQYSPTYVPRELLRRFKRAVKEMLGKVTMSDYLRVRVVNDARVKLKGPKHSMYSCNMLGRIDWSEIEWIKDPKDLAQYVTFVLYPKRAWEIFAHNCTVRREAPKHRICRYMLEIISEHLNWKKKKKRRKK